MQAQFKIGEFEFAAAGGDTPQEFEAALGGIVSALPLIREIQAELSLGKGSQPAPAAAPAVAPVYQLPQQPPASGVPTQTCAHGPMTRRTGNSSRGPWTGYFCSQPKGSPDQCKARFTD